MLKNFPAYVAWTRKAIINALGLLTSLLALGLLHDPYDKWVAAAIAVLTVISHFFTPNAPAPGTAPAQEEFNPDDEAEDPTGSYVPEHSFVENAAQVASDNEQAAPPSE